MKQFTRCFGLVMLLGFGASHVALAQSSGQVLQQERLVNVLLGQNQARINHQENAIAQQNTLLAELPGKTPRQEAQLIARINQLNVNLASALGRLTGGLDRTEAGIDRLEGLTPPNPFVASQLALYLQRTNLIFSTQLQEAEFIINRPPPSPTSFATAADPFGFGRRAATVRHVASQSFAGGGESRSAAFAAERAAATRQRVEAAAARRHALPASSRPSRP